MRLTSLALGVSFLCASATLPPITGCASRDAGKTILTTRPTTTRSIDPVIARIRDEGLNRSQVVETLDYLCNVIGPRLTGSPQMAQANLWTRDRLGAWGLENAHLEEWGPFGRGWTLERFSMRTTEPGVSIVNAFPKAWSPGFEEPLDASVIHLDATNDAGLEHYRGKLKGQIVLLGAARGIDARFEPLATRIPDARLALLEEAPAGVSASSIQLQPGTDTAAERRAAGASLNRGRSRSGGSTRAATRSATGPTAGRTTSPTTGPTTSPATNPADTFSNRMLAFAAEEGASLIVTQSAKGDGGTLFVTGAAIPGEPPRRPGDSTPRTRVWSADAPKIPAQITMGAEDYNRLARLAKRGTAVRANVDLAVKFHGGDQMQSNTLAEIEGTDLKEQIIMVGGHLDSWHSGAGATDNAVGASAAMEAVRIIKALGLKPRRTIRVALWSGEEQGIHGSSAYVKRHFGYVPDEQPAEPTTQAGPTTQAINDPTEPPGGRGNPATRPAQISPPGEIVRLPGHEQLSVYFNLDNGTGRIRGIYCQGNESAMPIFKMWLEPFHDLEARTVTLANTAATDHIPFDRVGLPGFQFIQDPIEYSSRTHHSNFDVFDRIQQQDMKQNATIMAAFIWNAANMDDRFPRKPTPAAKP